MPRRRPPPEALPRKDIVVLILSRKPGESIVIAGEIVVTVVELGRGRVQIGIDAPTHIPVYRNEIYERMTAAEALDEEVVAAHG